MSIDVNIKYSARCPIMMVKLLKQIGNDSSTNMSRQLFLGDYTSMVATVIPKIQIPPKSKRKHPKSMADNTPSRWQKHP